MEPICEEPKWLLYCTASAAEKNLSNSASHQQTSSPVWTAGLQSSLHRCLSQTLVRIQQAFAVSHPVCLPAIHPSSIHTVLYAENGWRNNRVMILSYLAEHSQLGGAILAVSTAPIVTHLQDVHLFCLAMVHHLTTQTVLNAEGGWHSRVMTLTPSGRTSRT